MRLIVRSSSVLLLQAGKQCLCLLGVKRLLSSKVRETGKMATACIDHSLSILHAISNEDFKRENDEIHVGSVVFRGCVGTHLQKSLSHLALVTEGYSAALNSGDNAGVIINISKPPMQNIDTSSRDSAFIFAMGLKNSLQTILSDERSLDLDVYVRYPPRDLGGLEFDIQSSLHKELSYYVRNYRHHSNIILAIMKYMNYGSGVEDRPSCPPAVVLE